MKNARNLWIVATLALLGAIAPAVADEVKDGEALAQRLCAKRHVVSQTVGPPFADIAKDPHASVGFLRDFLRSTHSDVSHPNAMPNPSLSQREIEALAAYIASLHHAE
jgi:cytochrome c551/c552